MTIERGILTLFGNIKQNNVVWRNKYLKLEIDAVTTSKSEYKKYILKKHI